ncbi:DUF167 domain-containing protein [Candidatus Babeliales bacterium]|nr:DUF167 domain-containing protein [Candidatus Babeliales bacterium]
MALIIEVKVEPSSRKQRFVLEKSGAIKCFIKSPAEGGRANDELLRLISKLLGIDRKQVSILMGAISRKKRVKIDADISYNEVLSKFGLEKQMSI